MHSEFKFTKMGASLSSMTQGFQAKQMLSILMGTLYTQFMDKSVQNFDEFHRAILDIFSSFNSALPGKHYDAPSPKEVEECFNKWRNAEEAKKREVFVEFMKKKVKLNKLDDSTMITGIVTPPAALAAKRAGEHVPQLKLIKHIPDVIFVPTMTILALVCAKLQRRMFAGSLASS